MTQGTTIVVPNADFSAMGFGRVPVADEEIAVSQEASLATWVSPDEQWLAENGTPRDRHGETMRTIVGAVAAGVINDGEAWTFPGVGNNVIRSVGNLLPETDWTLSIAAKPAAGSVTQFLCGSTSGSYFGLSRLSNNALQLIHNGASVFSPAVAWSTAAAHVMICYDRENKTYRMYFDGLFRQSAAVADHPSVRTLDIGNVIASAFPWNGQIGDFLLFSADLSADDEARAVVDAYHRWKYSTP